ncbi:MAG: SDR family NAD(P)-dependent oxidoreductase [Beijerinckiaceae bacterium]
MKIDQTVSAVVTGGASGLGETTARHLRSLGAKVAILDMQEERGKATAAAIGASFHLCNVTDEASVDAALAAARAVNGQERILANCAGIAPGKRMISKNKETGALMAHDLAHFVKVVNVNLIGTFLVTAKSAVGMASLAPVDADGQRGVIVCTASVAAEDGQVGQAAYAASKAGVKGMTLPVARDLAQYGIRICTILPGIFQTPMFDGLDDAFKKTLAAGVPFPSRLGNPEEYARTIAFIIENDYLNGETIRLDGAIRLAPR